MRVLLVGSGGREHALAATLARSPRLTALFIAPGNPGTAELGTNVAIGASDVPALITFAKEQQVDLIVPGPEAPLVAGLADACEAAGLACAGPTQAAARLEGSKSFSKEVCYAAGVPTARGERFTSADAAITYIAERGAPIVVKADGLAAGKGVVVAQTVAEAQDAVREMMTEGSMGDAGRSVVIEDCLVGEEVSLFAFCSGETAMLIGAAQDHKRIGDGDTGPNTGGMGAVSPPRGFDRTAQEAALDLVVRPMLKEMVRRGTPFRGVIFAGLMLTETGPQLIEYNVRFGDPEAQALLLRLTSDLLPALAALAEDRLDTTPVTFSDQAAISIVMAARGYPAKPETGAVISGIADAEALDGVRVFQAGTKENAARELVVAGGRVLSVCALGDTVQQARERAYAGVKAISWDGAAWRTDIGARALSRRTLTDEQWNRIQNLVLGQNRADNRLFVDAILWRAGNTDRWCNLPEDFGKHNTIRKRFRKWAHKGVWERLFLALADTPDFEYDLNNGTISKIHADATCTNRGLKLPSTVIRMRD